MKNFVLVICILLFGCNNKPSSNRGRHPEIDTSKEKASVTTNNVGNIKNIDTAINDTVLEFIKNNLYDIDILNLSFCQNELVKVLDENDSYKKEWRNKMKHLNSMYDDKFGYVTTTSEVEFFKNRLNAQSGQLQREYSDEYNFLMKSLPENVDSSTPIKKCQELMLRFNNVSGGDHFELSGVYFDFLIIDGEKFIGAIEGNPECIAPFDKWINNIEETEFVAYLGENVPPQVLERKRQYLIAKYSSETDPLMREAIDKIRKAKIRIID